MHEPVMVREVVAHLVQAPGGRYVDGTAGGGGHTEALLTNLGPDGRVLALDRDAAAVERVRTRLAGFGDRVTVQQGNYGELADLAAAAGWMDVDGVLLDLGVSSFQLDTAERGFSFMKDGPLDMRMDDRGGETAADLVNTWDEARLAALIRTCGEEPQANRVARALVRARAERPFGRTLELAAVVERALGGRRGGRHPATRTFQALRMGVNAELEHLEAGLEAAIGLLRPGGRLAVIAFHSLEDRAVKQCFVRHAGRWESLQQGGAAWRGSLPAVARVTRKALQPEADEVARNPRARSARLRVVERLAGAPVADARGQGWKQQASDGIGQEDS